MDEIPDEEFERTFRKMSNLMIFMKMVSTIILNSLNLDTEEQRPFFKRQIQSISRNSE